MAEINEGRLITRPDIAEKNKLFPTMSKDRLAYVFGIPKKIPKNPHEYSKSSEQFKQVSQNIW